MQPAEIDALLARARIGRLCMADDQFRPYAIPLPFCWRDGALYLRLPLAGRKGRILEHNNRVCFEVDEYTDTLDDYASVLIEGTLVPVSSLQEKADVKRDNDARYLHLRRGHRPGHGRTTRLEDLPLRKIVVQSLTGRRKEPDAATARPAPALAAP